MTTTGGGNESIGMVGGVIDANSNSYNIMHHHDDNHLTSGGGSGIRRLHRDYLKGIEDEVVLQLPWPTPNDEITDLLLRRSSCRRIADRITYVVVCYWGLSGIILLLVIGGTVSTLFVVGENQQNKMLLYILLGVSYLVSLIVVLCAHFQYHRYDAQIQCLVRAIMDVHGLGQQQQVNPMLLPPLRRSDINQQAQFRLPEFIDVMLQSAAEESLEFSTVTFRESLLARGISSGGDAMTSNNNNDNSTTMKNNADDGCGGVSRFSLSRAFGY